jgi:hypothetical protein
MSKLPTKIKFRGATYVRASMEDLLLSSVDEDGVYFSTGVPVTFPFIRNTEGAPNRTVKDEFQQALEPAGKYVLHSTNVPPGWAAGELTFNNPLVLVWSESGHYDDMSWKARLSRIFGATGAELSSILRSQGYDGIVTTDKYGTSEIVAL